MVYVAQPLTIANRANYIYSRARNYFNNEQLVSQLANYVLKYQAIIDNPNSDLSFLRLGLNKLALTVFTRHPNKVEIAEGTMNRIVGKVSQIATSAALIDFLDYMSKGSRSPVPFEPMWAIDNKLPVPNLEKTDTVALVNRSTDLRNNQKGMLQGFGFSESDGGIFTLINIMLDGFATTGLVRPIVNDKLGYFSTNIGYHFVIADSRHHHFAYIVATEADREFVLESLTIAASLGFINDEEPRAISERIITAAEVLKFEDAAFATNQTFAAQVILFNNQFSPYVTEDTGFLSSENEDI